MNAFNPWKLATILLAGAMIIVVANEPRNDEVSPNVVELLKRHFPDCRVTDVDLEKEDDERIHRIRLRDRAGKQNILAKVSVAGDLLELDEDISKEDLPQNVLKSFRRAFPKAEIEHAEKGTKMDVSYRIDIKQNGQRHEVKISRRGRVFEVESRR